MTLNQVKLQRDFFMLSLINSDAGDLQCLGRIPKLNLPEVRGEKLLRALEDLQNRAADAPAIGPVGVDTWVEDHDESAGCGDVCVGRCSEILATL